MGAVRISLFSAVALLCALPASAQERRWMTDSSSFGVEMMFGTPNSDDVLFAIRCDSRAKEIFVGFAYDPVGVQPGSTIDLDLYSEGGHVVLPAHVSYFPEMQVTLIETPNVTGAGLRPIFTKGSVLEVRVLDGGEDVSLSGMEADFDALFTACDE